MYVFHCKFYIVIIHTYLYLTLADISVGDREVSNKGQRHSSWLASSGQVSYVSRKGEG